MSLAPVGPRSLILVSTCSRFDKSQFSFFLKKFLSGLVLFWEDLVGALVMASLEPLPGTALRRGL